MATTDATASSSATLAAEPVPDVIAARGERPSPRSSIDALIVGVPALAALGLCLYDITSRSLWLDESATVAIAGQHGAAFGAALAHDGGNMLGYYALQHVLIGLFGSGAFVIRLPSALAAAATVALVGVLALRSFGRRVALAAGPLTAVSLSLVYWGQDARGYAPMVALIAGSFVAFEALLDGRARRGAWVAYTALTIAAVYAGLEAILVIPAQLVALPWFRHRARAVLSAVAVAAACCVPLAVLAAERGSGQLFWVPEPTLRVGKQVVQALASSGLQPSFYTATGTALLVLTVVILVVGAVRVASLVARGPSHTAAGPGLALSWLLVPIAVALLESTVQSVFQARYLLVSLPAVALLLAWTIAGPGVPRMLALGALTALLVLRVLQLAPAYGVSPENWRAATAYVLERAQPRDCTAFYPSDNRMPFEYYLRSPERAPRPVLPALPWGRVRPFVEDYASLSRAQVATLPTHCRRVWLVSSHEGRVGGPPVSRGNYLRYGALVAGLHAAYRRPQNASFGYHEAVTVTLFSP